jgi:hypothetical protein
VRAALLFATLVAAAPAGAQFASMSDVTGPPTTSSAIAGLAFAPTPAGHRYRPNVPRFRRTTPAVVRVAVVMQDGLGDAVDALAAALAPDRPTRAAAFAEWVRGMATPRGATRETVAEAVARWNAVVADSPSALLRDPPEEWIVVHRALRALARP